MTKIINIMLEIGNFTLNNFKTSTFSQIFNFMSKEKTVQKATKKEPAKSLKEKQADKKVKKESKKFRA
jgi:hypothetical protein